METVFPHTPLQKSKVQALNKWRPGLALPRNNEAQEVGENPSAEGNDEQEEAGVADDKYECCVCAQQFDAANQLSNHYQGTHAILDSDDHVKAKPVSKFAKFAI